MGRGQLEFRKLSHCEKNGHSSCGALRRREAGLLVHREKKKRKVVGMGGGGNRGSRRGVQRIW